METAKGTNLFFAIYYNKEKKKREYETIPLNRVIEHQKLDAFLPKNERTPVPINRNKGQFLFSLSPNDLVYVPTDEEIENYNSFDITKLTKEQITRVYKMVSATQGECHFVPNYYSNPIKKNEIGSNNKSQNTFESIQIKSKCWKLKIDRLGNIISMIK